MNDKIATIMNVNKKELFNDNFKVAEFREFKNDSAIQSFTMNH